MLEIFSDDVKILCSYLLSTIALQYLNVQKTSTTYY